MMLQFHSVLRQLVREMGMVQNLSWKGKEPKMVSLQGHGYQNLKVPHVF